MYEGALYTFPVLLNDIHRSGLSYIYLTCVRYCLHRHNGLHFIYTDNLVHKKKPDSTIGLVIPAQHHRTDDW